MKFFTILIFLIFHIIPGSRTFALHAPLTDNSNNYHERYVLYRTNNQPDSVLHFANLLIEESLKRQDIAVVVDYYKQTCEYLIDKQQYQEAVHVIQSFIEFAEQQGNDQYKAIAYFKAADLFMYANLNGNTALEYYNKCIELCLHTRNYYELGRVYFRIGNYYSYYKNEPDTGLYYISKSVAINQEHEFHKLLYNNYFSLADIYRHKLKNYTQSREYYRQALNLAKITNDTINMAMVYREIGCVDLQYNKPDSVLHHYQIALNLLTKINAKPKLLNPCYMHLCVYHESHKEYEKALKYSRLVSDNAFWGLENNWLLDPLLKTAQLEQKLGYHEEAAQHYMRYIHRKDSINKLWEVKEFAHLELKFELEKLELANHLQEEENLSAIQKQKTIRNFLLLLATSLIAILYLLYRNHTNQQSANRLKLQFLTNISHELRTPLTLLIAPLESISTKLKASEDQKTINLMLRNAYKLKSLINQLLDVSKLDSNRLILKTDLHDFNSVFRTVTAMFNSMAEEKHIDFRVLTEPQELIFRFEKERVEQILTNLLSNAFKFTPAGGTIVAHASKADDYLLLRIKDSGIGIRPEDMNHIFKRFFQSKKGGIKGYEGTGIGLHIVEEYVKLHQGSVTVKSDLGKGSEFTVKLPLFSSINDIRNQSAKSFSKIHQESKSLPPRESSKKNESILIVEDNKDLRAYLKGIFQKHYQVLEAANGEIGKEVSVKENPDIILSDVMMPVCDGYCLTEYIKTQVETSHIPILLLTAKTRQKDILTGYQHGADDYIAKPFNEQELLLKVQNILQTRRKQREKYKKKINIAPSDITVTSLDAQLLKKMIKVVEQNISNNEFNIDQLCTEVGLSRRNLFRKTKALTDMPPREFIRSIRLNRAAQLLAQGAGTVGEIALQTGFENLSHFTKCFKETFNRLPSEHLLHAETQHMPAGIK